MPGAVLPEFRVLWVSADQELEVAAIENGNPLLPQIFSLFMNHVDQHLDDCKLFLVPPLVKTQRIHIKMLQEWLCSNHPLTCRDFF